jgi:hypothetical protein
VKAPTQVAPKVAWPVVVVVATAVFGTIPHLVTKWFYQRGDTAVQFAPTWYHLGHLTRDGVYPAWLDPNTWAGGNYAAEALFGIYDPLNLPVWLYMSASSDLMVSTFVVKLCFLVLLALGTYFLAREYDAAPWAAAAVAVALPFSGFTLFWDAGSWASGLIAFSYTPWVWLGLRRVRRGASNPFWGFVVGALAVTQGNPYGVLALVVIGVALVLEGLLDGDRTGVLKLAGAGACAALVLPLVYLPLLGTSSLTVRSLGALIANTGKMQPAPGDLLQLSMPTSVPPIEAILGRMAVPATFLAWFVLPLLPWLRWSELRARALVGPLGVGVVYLALVLAPSKLWQFRWPLRVSEYLYLAVVVLFARALTAGLATTHVRRRMIASAVVIGVPSYLAWAQNPAVLHRLVWGTLLVAGLTALALLAWRMGPARTLALGCVLIVGTGLGVVLQLKTFGENKSSRVWHVPSNVSALQRDFSDRTGVVMQFVNFTQLQHTSVRQLEKQWRYYLPGSLYDVAGVDSVNHYTGMGLVRFERSLCMSYDGFTRPCGFASLWRPPEAGVPPLADLMKVDTVVVDPGLAGRVKVPSGWHEVSSPPEVLVYQRTQPEPWPDSHLSLVPQGATVTGAVSDDVRHEHVDLSSTGSGGTAVFGMLGWPGWTATFDGHSVPVGRDSAGLLTVRLPAQASGTLELSFEPPGLKVGVAAALLGFVAAVVLGWFGRRRRFADDDAADADDGDAAEGEEGDQPAQGETRAPAGAHVRDETVDPA